MCPIYTNVADAADALITQTLRKIPSVETRCVCVCAFTFITLAGTNLYKNVVLRGCGRLRGSISYFLATRPSQMNAEAANDVDPKYQLNPRSIVSITWRPVGRRCVGVYSNICVVAR